MKPLYKHFTDKNKETAFSLYIHDVFESITERANEWFNQILIEDKIVPDEILTSNLKSDLDYLFTKGIWLINLGKSLGYNVSDIERPFESFYNVYTNKKKRTGYRFLVTDKRYNPFKHKVYTEKQIKNNLDKQNEMMRTLFLKFKKEEEKEK